MTNANVTLEVTVRTVTINVHFPLIRISRTYVRLLSIVVFNFHYQFGEKRPEKIVYYAVSSVFLRMTYCNVFQARSPRKIAAKIFG